jgi:hypothetical protein
MVTPLDFGKAVLSKLGMPDSQNNREAMVAFGAIEGGHWYNKARYNPYNTTMAAPGATVMPGSAAQVKAYTSWGQGLDATVKTINNGLYGGILRSLSASAPPDDTLAAIGASKWGWNMPVGPAESYWSYADKPDPVGGTLFFAEYEKELLLGGVVLAGLAYAFRHDVGRLLSRRLT